MVCQRRRAIGVSDETLIAAREEVLRVPLQITGKVPEAIKRIG